MRIKQAYLRNGLILIHILFAVIGFYIYLFNYKLSENLLVQKTLNKQIVLAKSGSLSVDNLIKNVQNDLSSLIFTFTKIEGSAPIDINNTRTAFIAYMRRAQLPINGIALYDATGKLVLIENRHDIRIGENQDFSNTAFIQWSKRPINKDKTFISTPYIGTTGASVGKIILIIAKPVYFGNTYRGTLSIRLLVDDFTKAFIAPLSSDVEENTFILDSNGVLIAGNSFLLDKNIFEYARKQKWTKYKDFTNKLGLALKTNVTQTKWIFQNPHEKPKELLVGISKIDIPDTDKDLYMIVTAPKDDIVFLLNPLRAYGLVWLGFGVFTTTFGGIIVILLRDSE